MAAVIRVKRFLDDEPQGTLILNCKKRKTEQSNSENVDSQLSTVLKFAGTIESQENEDILKHIKKSTKEELEAHYKKHAIDINTKLRQQKQEDAKNNRYKVVNLFRSNDRDVVSKISETEDSEFTVLDIEHVENKMKNLIKEPKYVYDLYYTTSDDLGDVCLEEYVSLHPMNDPLVFGSMRDNGLNALDSDDSEDSNAENNWRNDYPDESDMDSVTEDDMIKAVENLNIENDLSSDEGEEGFVYSIDSEGAGFEEDIDETDVRRYGEMYARFKSRNKITVQTTEFNKDFYYGDIDEEDYDY